MILSLGSDMELKNYIKKQLANVLPDNNEFDGRHVEFAIKDALERLEYCFSHIIRDGYHLNGTEYFNHLHSDQYSMFLYFLSNSLWRTSGDKILCDKLTVLNRMLSGLFVTYKCELPEIFFLNHPVGTVIGNAHYSDYLVIGQNVTINTGELYLGKYVFLGTGCTLIGELPIGDNVAIGANTLVYKQKIPDNTIVYTNCITGAIECRLYTKNIAKTFFS